MGGRNINFKPCKMDREILVIADIHGNFAYEKVQKILQERNISEIFVLGDFPPHGSRSLENVEDFLNEISLYAKIYAIPGNCDSREILKIFDKFNANKHNKIGNIEGINADFVCFGGSNITPFNTPFEYEEDEIYKNLKGLFEVSKSEKKILITHCPPFNTNCDLAGERHVGSIAIRRIIEEFQPEINFCSHVHECYGKEDFIGKTKIVNVGELRRGCEILKFGKKIETERINFDKF